MSMMPPPFPADPSGDGIPAADPGAGAPEPAPGFGVGGEEPDLPEDGQPEDAEATQARENPFRTPDPAEIGPDQND
jgi:hypothetical protein